MKTYKSADMPSDSVWNRKSIRLYIPNWLLEITDGIKNIFVWMPIIYKDKHWDNYYIFEILKKKIELQRNYLVSHNRHLDVPRDNYFMTVCLNLIERIQEETYSLEYMDYNTTKFDFTPCEDNPKHSTLDTTLLTENFDDFLKKYPLVVKHLIKEKPSLADDKQSLCFYVSHHNQKRCKDLLFKILNHHIERWWD